MDAHRLRFYPMATAANDSPLNYMLMTGKDPPAAAPFGRSRAMSLSGK
jgi:hypothetical protein